MLCVISNGTPENMNGTPNGTLLVHLAFLLCTPKSTPL